MNSKFSSLIILAIFPVSLLSANASVASNIQISSDNNIVQSSSSTRVLSGLRPNTSPSQMLQYQNTASTKVSQVANAANGSDIVSIINNIGDISSKISSVSNYASQFSNQLENLNAQIQQIASIPGNIVNNIVSQVNNIQQMIQGELNKILSVDIGQITNTLNKLATLDLSNVDALLSFDLNGLNGIANIGDAISGIQNAIGSIDGVISQIENLGGIASIGGLASTLNNLKTLKKSFSDSVSSLSDSIKKAETLNTIMEIHQGYANERKYLTRLIGKVGEGVKLEKDMTKIAKATAKNQIRSNGNMISAQQEADLLLRQMGGYTQMELLRANGIIMQTKEILRSIEKLSYEISEEETKKLGITGPTK